MSQHAYNLLSKEREEITKDLPLTLSLKQACGSITPINQPEDFAAVRDAAIEDHVQSVADKMNNE